MQGEAQFSAAVEPELLAHHYTEAARIEETIGYWLKAGKRAMQRSANIEAEGLHASLMARLDRLGPATGEAFRE